MEKGEAMTDADVVKASCEFVRLLAKKDGDRNPQDILENPEFWATDYSHALQQLVKVVEYQTRAEQAEARVEELGGKFLDITGELYRVDDILARRPALDDCKTRWEKIERAISTAKLADEAKAKLAAVVALHQLSVIATPEGLICSQCMKPHPCPTLRAAEGK